MVNTPALRTFITTFKAKLRMISLKYLVSVDQASQVERLGSSYGGWWIPLGELDSSSVCYLAGVGEDVTFDLELVDRVGCHVWSIDPTPRAQKHVAAIDEPRFHFLPVGLWFRQEQLVFYAPENPEHVSHSVIPASDSGRDSFIANCLSVRDIMAERNHDRLDLLKMDIEGAEVAVLDDILRNGPLPTVLCVEFDAPEWPGGALKRIRRLRSAGYSVAYIEGLNVTFVRRH